MASLAHSETVPSQQPAATVLSSGGWYFDSSLRYPPFPGAPTGQAFCNYWGLTFAGGTFANQLVFKVFSSGAGGWCTVGTGNATIIAQPEYLEVCPPGYGSSTPGYTVKFTCYNYSAPNQCPAVATGETPYTLDPGGQTCSRCPPNSIGTPPSCTCNEGYEPDSSGTLCVAKCAAIDPLPDFPKDDLCATSLEAGRGKDINKVCPDITSEMQKQADCLAAKIHALGLSYTGPSATIRNVKYQKHLRDVWDKWDEIKNTPLSDEEKLVCADFIADIKNHMDWHDFDSAPSKKGNEAPHVKGEAIDIPKDVALKMMRQISNMAFITFPDCIFCSPIATITFSDVQDYVNSTTVNTSPCNLKWGGRFLPVDKVHFQLPSQQP